ncbi:MAG: hypothetical protein R3B84_22105, partial [Zavarzinella sp.]
MAKHTRPVLWNGHVDFRWEGGGVTINSPDGFPIMVPMAGLYFQGNYLHDCNSETVLPVLNNNNERMEILWGTGVEYPALDTGEMQDRNWYGVFAVNENGVLRGKFVSFIRVFCLDGRSLTFSSHRDKDVSINYGFCPGAYLGSRYVVLTGLDAGKTGTITKSLANSFDLADPTPHRLAKGDWLMVSPAKGLRSDSDVIECYREYCYLGSVLSDNLREGQYEPKNFYKYRNRYFIDNNNDNLYDKPFNILNQANIGWESPNEPGWIEVD